MSIQLLPLQLANQIAAGEVVERPAAVVKELVENSLDAGARHIDIEIEGGGSQLIRIRDDGTGIPKEELALALARHATSKIGSLADLQAVTTMGFRGEALASINAVSRLSITSRTDQQAQAWQIYAEGREATSLFRPLSHPIGTTVEVLELFYNVPARRKFLCSAKTEFSHIDEVVRRIALSHFGLSLTLTHNGKRIRYYRPVSEKVTREQRLAALCGRLFAQQARVVSGGQQPLVLQGWVAAPLSARAHSQLQYGYVNGRAIRDKVMIHAVRQAYQYSLAPQHYPNFVLFLTMDPQEVDVNVHPTKQEVRFQQARLIHDFIYQSVLAVITEQAHHPCSPEPPPGTAALAAASQPADPSLTASTLTASAGVPAVPCPQSRRAGLPEKERVGWCTAKLVPYRALSQSDDTLKVGREAQPAIDKNSQTICRGETGTLGDQPVAARSLGRVLMIWQPHYAVLERPAGLALLSLPTGRQYWQRAQLLPATEEASKHSLLFPLTLPLSLPQAAAAARYQPLLAQLALVFTLERHQLILQAVPPLLAQQALSSLLLALLDYLHPLEQAEAACIVEWLVQRLAPEQQGWRLSQAIQLLAELERSCPHLVDLPPIALLQPIDLAAALAQLKQSS